MAATQEQLIAGIAEIIEEVTGIEPSEVTPEKSFVDDLDIDSLSMVEIAVQTEDKYGVKVPDEDLAGLKTVGDAVAYIQKLEAENPEAAAAIARASAEGGGAADAPASSETEPNPFEAMSQMFETGRQTRADYEEWQAGDPAARAELGGRG